MPTTRGIYIHHPGKSGWHAGWGLLTCGLEIIGTWAGQNRASILMKQSLYLSETEASFCYNRASVESNYSKKKVKLYTFAFRGDFSQKHRWKGTFLKNWKLKAVFYFLYLVGDLAVTSRRLDCNKYYNQWNDIGDLSKSSTWLGLLQYCFDSSLYRFTLLQSLNHMINKKIPGSAYYQGLFLLVYWNFSSVVFWAFRKK